VNVISEKVKMINNRKSPIRDEYIEKYLTMKDLNLVAILDGEVVYRDAGFVVITAPTNYDSKKNYFDTSAVETVIKLVMSVNSNATMVIKSTIPVGYTASVREKLGSENIIFSPESFVNPRHSMITFIRQELFFLPMILGNLTQMRRHLQSSYRRVQLRKILTHCLWASLRQRQLSCLSIHIWHFVCHTSMNWTLTLR